MTCNNCVDAKSTGFICLNCGYRVGPNELHRCEADISDYRIAELEAEVERLRAVSEQWRSLWAKSGLKTRVEVLRELGFAEGDAANKKPSPEACE